MSRIFITGSADGLGHLEAELLVKNGHKVVVHGRDKQRAEYAMKRVPGAEACVYGDLSSIMETMQLAQQVNELGTFDAIIHNAAVGDKERKKILTVDGLPHVFAINSLAPYILTSLIARPKRLIYTSSGMHRGGDTSLDDLTWEKREWYGVDAYSDSKFHDLLLAFAVARHWKDVLSNAVDPGWVPTKMGGPAAPDSLDEGPQTQVWLAVAEGPEAEVTGKYFHHQAQRTYLSAADKQVLQDKFLQECERLSGVKFPV